MTKVSSLTPTNGSAVNLAHRRLSIIDLSGGHQPFVKEPLALCYNGELYNYREIRAELPARGRHLRHLIGHRGGAGSLASLGPGVPGRFRGMFAFALFDETSGSLFLARDQLGIKPLHYLLRDDGVVFASELKALVGRVRPELRMDPAALVASMLYYWVPDQRCSIGGVEKLQPGTWAEFRPDGTYQVRSLLGRGPEAADAAAGTGRSTWARSSRRRSPPIWSRMCRCQASCRGGWTPASSPCWPSGPIRTSMPTPSPSGRRITVSRRCPTTRLYARKVAGRYGIRLHEIQIAPDIVETLPRMVGILDEPIGDPAAINTLLMCEAARSAGVKVILSGMGADELFGGYRKHLACVMAARYRRLPGLVRDGPLPARWAGFPSPSRAAACVTPAGPSGS